METVDIRAGFIDDIRVSAVRLCNEAPVLASISNPSFEEPVEMFESAVVTSEPTGAGWTFTDDAAIGHIQSLNPSERKMPQAVPEGIGTAMIPVIGSISQSVTFPTSGVYRLSFAAAARIGAVNHTFNVMFDDDLVRAFTMTDTAFKRYDLTLPGVETGVAIELAFVGTGGVDTASLIDNIRIERIGADEAVDALQNGGFEEVKTESPLVTTNWVCTSSAGVMTNNNAWGETVPYGTYMGYTAMIHSFSQTVTFAQSGNYALRFVTKTRTAYVLPQFHDFDVYFGGERVSRIFNLGGDLRSYELTLPPVTAGVSYGLQFKGLQTYTGINTLSLYDQIEIVPAPAARLRQSVTGRFPETTMLDVAEGAELVLDFEGEITVQTVRYAGHIVSGTIDAATHPEFVSGTGSILSPSKGSLIMLK